jgi:DNA-binding NtrC family response regulator
MRILIIDDEENIRRITAVVLEAAGYETVSVENGADALKQLESGTFDVAFLDLKLGGESGLELLPELLKASPQLEVIVFTAFASIETAVEAMRQRRGGLHSQTLHARTNPAGAEPVNPGPQAPEPRGGTGVPHFG